MKTPGSTRGKMAMRPTTVRGQNRLFVVDDHPVFREGLVRILDKEKDFAVCGEAGDAAEASRGIAQLKPDLVLMDITLPGKNGLELMKELRAARNPVRILALSMHDEALYANRVLRAGGHGYIMKDEDPDEIVHAIRAVLGGRTYVSERVFAASSKPCPPKSANTNAVSLEDLTDSELEVMELLGHGKSNAQIARQLRLRVEEVAGSCVRIQRKLKLGNANALVRLAVLHLSAR